MKKCEINDIETIINYLDNENIIAIPTDTIYGLATRVEYYERITELKQRNNKPLAILCSSIEEMANIIEIPDKYMSTLKQLTPGALTIVGKTINDKYAINNGINTTGVRIPKHSSLLNILKLTGPLVVSSANLSGESETYSIEEVAKIFDNKIDLYVDNDQELSKTASTVINIDTLEVYRESQETTYILNELKSVDNIQETNTVENTPTEENSIKHDEKIKIELEELVNDEFLKRIANYTSIIGISATIGLIIYLVIGKSTVFGILSVIMYVILSLISYFAFSSNIAYPNKSNKIILHYIALALSLIILITAVFNSITSLIPLLLIIFISIISILINVKKLSKILKPILHKLSELNPVPVKNNDNSAPTLNTNQSINSAPVMNTNINIQQPILDPKTLLFNKTQEILNQMSYQDRSEKYYTTIFNNNNFGIKPNPISIVFSSKNICFLSINYNTNPISINVFYESFNFFRNYNIVQNNNVVGLTPIIPNIPKLVLTQADSFKFISLFNNNQSANNMFYENLIKSKTTNY